MSQLKRRTFLKTAAAASASLSLPGLVRAATDQEVIVGTWGGDFGDLLQQSVDAKIMEPNGFKVLREISGAVARKTKLMAERTSRRGSMDVVCLADFDLFAASRVGALAPLNGDNVAKFDDVLPFLATDYSIPFIYSAHSIVYNTEMIPKKPESIQELWTPDYAGKVGLLDALYTTNTAYAAMANGGSMTDFGPAREKLAEWKELGTRVYASTEALGAAFKTGEIWMGITTAARAYMWSKDGVPLGWSISDQGAFPAVYGAAVPANARNPEACLDYLNAMLSPEVQAQYAKVMGYLPTVDSAKLDPDLEAILGFSPAEQERIWKADLGYIMENQAAMLDVWNRDFKG